MTPPLLAGLAALTILAAPPASGQPSAGGAGECRVEGDALAASDVALAREACEAARARFRKLLGDDVPGVVVLLEDRPGYRIGILRGHAVIMWPTSEALERRVTGPAEVVATHLSAQWRDVLPHEIGHALTAAFFFPEGRFRSTGYGTSLPDWFEEAVAIWLEPVESRESRVDAARRLPPHRLHLPTILTGRHPAAGNAAVMSVRDGAAPPDDAALWDFYQQSIAVLAFIHDRGGQRAVRALAFRLMADPTDPEPIVGLPGLPAEMEGVLAAWDEWLARDPAGVGR